MDRLPATVSGAHVVGARPVTGGYTHNLRRVLTLDDGRTVFMKRAVDQETADWLRTEWSVYQALAGAPFLAAVVAWEEGPLPTLVLEDLSAATWPPPWSFRQIDALLATLASVHQARGPTGVPKLRSHEGRPGAGWDRVQERPEELLGLGLCSAAWLERALPVFASAAAAADVEGDALLHCDVRSDNVCFDGARVRLIDWNLVVRGNPLVDVAFWLPSLSAEGGPRPNVIAPEIPAGLAAFVAGFFAGEAGQPVIPHAPRVRRVQLDQLRVALPWAARSCGLPPPE
jgi:aminoglycoside phosphotransferase (APT) family kinase protein